MQFCGQILQLVLVLGVSGVELRDNDAISIEEACRRNPHLLACKFDQNITLNRIKRDDENDKRHRQELIDKAACGILVADHHKLCVDRMLKTVNESIREFCEAFDNICSKFEKDQSIENHSSAISREESSGPKRRDFTKFCPEFKQRYLYVCPDPLRFGKKAIVFCPLYAEKCRVPLPEKPVAATRRPRRQNFHLAIARLCAENREFALNYCYNPILLQQRSYRDACMKYRYFCTRTPH